MDEQDNSIVNESENWNAGQKSFGFKEIVMRQLQKVVTNMSQEMRKGFWVYSNPSPNIDSQKIKYVGDSRRELRQSLDVLHDLLKPKFDEIMKKQSEEIYKEYNAWWNKWVDKSVNEAEEGSYWNKTLKIYRRLFQEICEFLERLGWLEAGALED